MSTQPFAKDARIAEIVSYFTKYGVVKTAEFFHLSTETVHRYIREYERTNIESKGSMSKLLQSIQAQYTKSELEAIAKGGQIKPGQKASAKIDFSGTSFKFCFFTDPHTGSMFFKEELFYSMLEEGRRQKVDAYMCAGDVTDGLSHRPGHVYELTQIGYAKQKEYGIKLFSEIEKDFYVIDGNHDRWYIKSNGALIVKDICEHLPKAHYLGHDTGNIEIKKSIIQLWHGEDGSSYATSYRVQKIIESLTGGTKPNVLLLGHTHKQLYMFERHIHAVSGGALSVQTNWMRSKRLANHSGFWIITAYINKQGFITRFLPEWFPAYL